MQKLNQLVGSGLEFSGLALMQDHLKTHDISPQLNELITKGITKVIGALMFVDAGAAFCVMSNTSNPADLEKCFTTKPAAWKVIEDGIIEMVSSEEVLELMIVVDPTPWMQDTDVVAAHELYLKSMNAKHGTDFDIIEDIPK